MALQEDSHSLPKRPSEYLNELSILLQKEVEYQQNDQIRKLAEVARELPDDPTKVLPVLEEYQQLNRLLGWTDKRTQIMANMYEKLKIFRETLLYYQLTYERGVKREDDDLEEKERQYQNACEMACQLLYSMLQEGHDAASLQVIYECLTKGLGHFITGKELPNTIRDVRARLEQVQQKTSPRRPSARFSSVLINPNENPLRNLLTAMPLPHEAEGELQQALTEFHHRNASPLAFIQVLIHHQALANAMYFEAEEQALLRTLSIKIIDADRYVHQKAAEEKKAVKSTNDTRSFQVKKHQDLIKGAVMAAEIVLMMIEANQDSNVLESLQYRVNHDLDQLVHGLKNDEDLEGARKKLRETRSYDRTLLGFGSKAELDALEKDPDAAVDVSRLGDKERETLRLKLDELKNTAENEGGDQAAESEDPFGFFDEVDEGVRAEQDAALEGMFGPDPSEQASFDAAEDLILAEESELADDDQGQPIIDTEESYMVMGNGDAEDSLFGEGREFIGGVANEDSHATPASRDFQSALLFMNQHPIDDEEKEELKGSSPGSFMTWARSEGNAARSFMDDDDDAEIVGYLPGTIGPYSAPFNVPEWLKDAREGKGESFMKTPDDEEEEEGEEEAPDTVKDEVEEVFERSEWIEDDATADVEKSPVEPEQPQPSLPREAARLVAPRFLQIDLLREIKEEQAQAKRKRKRKLMAGAVLAAALGVLGYNKKDQLQSYVQKAFDSSTETAPETRNISVSSHPAIEEVLCGKTFFEVRSAIKQCEEARGQHPKAEVYLREWRSLSDNALFIQNLLDHPVAADDIPEKLNQLKCKGFDLSQINAAISRCEEHADQEHAQTYREGWVRLREYWYAQRDRVLKKLREN